MKRFVFLIALCMPVVLLASSLTAIAYAIIQNNGVTVSPSRQILNFVPGSNVTLGIVDDPGNLSTDVTINAGSAIIGTPLASVSLTFSPAAGATTTLTHNFGNANHVTTCQDSSGNVFIPSVLTLGANSDAITTGAAMTNAVCTAINSTGALTNSLNIVTKTSAYQLLASDSGSIFTNTGASGSVVLTLPTSANTTVGLHYEVYVDAAQTLEVLAGTGVTIQVAGVTGGTAGNAQSATSGDIIDLVALSTTRWVARKVIGVWSVT